jgi:hypothetical protein
VQFLIGLRGGNKMLIRFGVCKREKVNGKTISKNDGIEFPVTMEEFRKDVDNVHQKIRKAIYEKYPGWSIMGYCPK